MKCRTLGPVLVTHLRSCFRLPWSQCPQVLVPACQGGLLSALLQIPLSRGHEQGQLLSLGLPFSSAWPEPRAGKGSPAPPAAPQSPCGPWVLPECALASSCCPSCPFSLCCRARGPGKLCTHHPWPGALGARQAARWVLALSLPARLLSHLF